MPNPTRHESNLNNEYIETFQSAIRESQSEGYYVAKWISEWDYWGSSRELTKVKAAAQAVCNRSEFEGTSHEIEWDCDMDDIINDVTYYCQITVIFNW